MVKSFFKIFKLLLFVVLYIKLMFYIHDFLQLKLPTVILGTWRSYVIVSLLFTCIDAAVSFVGYALGWCSSFVHRSRFVKIMGFLFTAILFVFSEIQLWQFVDALYYSGFWEYYWGLMLSIFIFYLYGMIATFCLISPDHKLIKDEK